MFHSGAQTLIDLWTALPDSHRIPARSAFDPMRVGGLAPQMFSADRQGTRLRLAGAWIERMHGLAVTSGSLRGQDWLSLWAEDSQPLVASSIVQAFREARPVVLAADAAALTGLIEVVILPLRGPAGEADRFIGLYQPADHADRNAEDIGRLSARLAIGVGPTHRAPLALAAVQGRRIA